MLRTLNPMEQTDRGTDVFQVWSHQRYYRMVRMQERSSALCLVGAPKDTKKGARLPGRRRWNASWAKARRC